jgi:hypothetical protein
LICLRQWNNTRTIAVTAARGVELTLLEQYRRLVDRHNVMTTREPWWEDGRWEKLAGEMARLWNRLDGSGQAAALAYQQHRYEEGLKQ